MENYFVRECIPGYTGHIRKKKFTAGLTEGEINRQLLLKGSVESRRTRNNYFAKCESLTRNTQVKDKYGYHSRHAIGWIGSPTYDLFPQHIPCTFFAVKCRLCRTRAHFSGREYCWQVVC
eukprot:TRINITY_DN15928_c0_g3_i2.p1 TRINITY_DN15928_c0_g3~~TRINITY_DN15928_c0_g3_i2.p1  ORF type:complete len:120 (-),score=0.68 TRINITY_DN15928_c0_g3_i2:217-576(-)